jgi:LPXTG-motif cell wall-anchored protein
MKKTPLYVFRLFKNVPKMYIPMIWFELTAEVSEEMSSGLRQLLGIPIVMLSIGITMIVVGLCLIGGVAFLYFKKRRQVIPTVRAHC